MGADDVRLTRDVDLKVLPRLAAGARIAVMDGHPDSITTPKRHRGFLDAMSGFPEMRLVESVNFAPLRIPGGGDRSEFSSKLLGNQFQPPPQGKVCPAPR